MSITQVEAEKMSQDILSKNDKVLGILIMDMRGNILASNSKELFKRAFGTISKKDKEYGPSLSIAMLALANQEKDVFGEPQAIITIFKRCKAMLIPSQPDQIMVGLVLERSANAEEFLIAEKNIEGLLLLRQYKKK
jgi:hypothetical protein